MLLLVKVCTCGSDKNIIKVNGGDNHGEMKNVDTHIVSSICKPKAVDEIE